MRARPLTVDDLIAVWKRVTPPEYHVPIMNDPRGSFAIVRAVAKMYAALSEKIHRSAQATFILPSALQVDVPASSGVRATFDADVQRTRDLDQARVIGAGELQLSGPQGRRYENVSEVTWIPFDTAVTKTIEFQAIAPGYVFNLDHIADPDGLITAGIYDPNDPANPNANGPDLAKVAMVPRSNDRTSTGASIIAAIGPDARAQIRDSGRPNVFLATDVGLYIKIESATNPDNVGRVLRVIGFVDDKIEDPPDSGLFPRNIIVDDGPQRFRLLSAQADDGGVLTNQTVAANEESPDDMTLLPAAPAVNDAYYFGAHARFRSVVVDVSVAGEGVWTLTWEYWNGATWAALADVVDATTGFQASGVNDVRYTLPADWASNTVNGVAAFHIRARVSAFTSITQQPLGRQAYAMIQQQLLAESGAVTWSILDWIDLGFELARIEAATGGRDDDLRILGFERGIAQQDGESDTVFRERLSRLAEVVTPRAIRSVVNRQLEPFGFAGQAFDIGTDTSAQHFEGLFADIDAADYYEPGDAFPESPYHLPLSHDEAYGHFWVRVPYLGFGDFGMAADEGPTYLLTPPGLFIGPAADFGFVDGYPVDGNAIYAAIYDAVYRIRGGGIGFSLLRDEALNVPVCP